MSNQEVSITEDARELQERLHELLTRLAATTDVVKHWPESEADDPSVHVETTNGLIALIQEVVKSIEKVEGVIKTREVLSKTLRECPVPLDLLDLMDYSNGVNPECFSRELLREALGQLAGLQRRKLALQMLGAEIQSGLNKRNAASNASLG